MANTKGRPKGSRKYTALNGKKVYIKYGNRKLYDTVESKYVSVQEVAKNPTGSFIVTEHSTGNDITSETLLSALTQHFSANLDQFEIVRDTLVEKFINN